jgi:ASC-1-like (ASCH) protein
MQNSFPMAEWHVEHMERIVNKFVTGLSETATKWEKKQNKRYGRISIVCRQIEYDIKHGATTQQVLIHIQKIRTHSTFLSLLKNEGSLNRLNQLKEHFAPSVEKSYAWSR